MSPPRVLVVLDTAASRQKRGGSRAAGPVPAIDARQSLLISPLAVQVRRSSDVLAIED